MRELDLRVLEARLGNVSLALLVTTLRVNAGGVSSGQTPMAAFDTAMVLAAMSKLGAFRPMTTVRLQTSFLRPVPADARFANGCARVLRFGKSLAFGDIQVTQGEDVLAAHATATCALQ